MQPLTPANGHGLEPRCEPLKERLNRAAGEQAFLLGTVPCIVLILWGCTPAPQEKGCFLSLKISKGRDRGVGMVALATFLPPPLPSA